MMCGLSEEHLRESATVMQETPDAILQLKEQDTHKLQNNIV